MVLSLERRRFQRVVLAAPLALPKCLLCRPPGSGLSLCPCPAGQGRAAPAGPRSAGAAREQPSGSEPGTPDSTQHFFYSRYGTWRGSQLGTWLL